MVVGTCRLTFELEGVLSLKEKRAIVRKLVDRARHRFNAAVSEVDALDAHRRLVIGTAVVSNETGHASAMLEEIVAQLESGGHRVLDRHTEIFHIGERAPVTRGVLGSWDELEAES